ncbi:MAG: hypothetical protein IH787_06990, partial [Nitrospirae bacterium]|nr:hypothetical protein [Nitrospirota bacterium]
MSEYLKPIPVPSEDSNPYWEGDKRHEFCLQRCQACGAFRLPPAPLCPECTVLGGVWTKVSGRGKVYSFENTRDGESVDLVIDLKQARPDLQAIYGLTFHPKIDQNGFVFVCYIVSGGDGDGTRVSRFKL